VERRRVSPCLFLSAAPYLSILSVVALAIMGGGKKDKEIKGSFRIRGGRVKTVIVRWGRRKKEKGGGEGKGRGKGGGQRGEWPETGDPPISLPDADWRWKRWGYGEYGGGGRRIRWEEFILLSHSKGKGGGKWEKTGRGGRRREKLFRKKGGADYAFPFHNRGETGG